MCGLIGYFSLNEPLKQTLMNSMLNAQKHRGPDQGSFWSSNDAKVGLGQNRLSINDLSQLNLPFQNKDKSITVVANAEIYNHHLLRAELKQKGYQFRTRCDVEVLPFLYEEYGINFINKLRGEFSFIIWDNNQKSFFAVRDRFGVKPLYYTVIKNTIFFASEIPTLFRINSKYFKWDIQAFIDFNHLSLPYDKTLYEGIKQVPPGHYYSIEQNTHALRNYWDIHYNPLKSTCIKDSILSIREKLIEAVDIRMQADVPIGFYLSGGLDSATLLGIASRNNKIPLETFSIEFPDCQMNESAIAEIVCQGTGNKFNKVLVAESDIIEHFEHFIRHTCTPISNTAGIARFLLSKFTREFGFKAVLSGEGADEVFLGYFGAIIEALEDPTLSADYELSIENEMALLNQLPVNRNGKLPDGIYKIQPALNHIPSWIITMTYFNACHRNMLNKEIFAGYSNYNPYFNLINSLNTQQKLTHFDKVQVSSYTWIKSFFPNNMLNFIGDRAEMAHSIEARQPFLDHELFELLATIPTVLKIKGGVEKYLLREAAKPFINETVYKRKKFMFQAPPLQLDPNNKLYNFICDQILGHIDHTNLYDKAKVLQLMDQSRSPCNFSSEKQFEISYALITISSMLILNSSFKLY